MGPKDEWAMGENLNATIALLPYIDLTWVKRIMGAMQIQVPDVLERGTYVYAGFFFGLWCWGARSKTCNGSYLSSGHEVL